MNAKELYKSLDTTSRRELINLAEEINAKYQMGPKAGQEMGRVILFFGAAIHYHAPGGFEASYSKEQRPPLGAELANLYIDDLFPVKDFPEENISMKAENMPLSWITQYYEEVKDRRKLIAKLNEFIGNRKPSPILKALARMNFKYVVTTNYDNLFEDALSAVGKEYHKGVYKPNRGGFLSQCTPDVAEADVNVNNPFLFKLHGDIREPFSEDGSYDYNKDAIVITDEDYLHFILRMSQIVEIKERGSGKDGTGDLDYYPIPQSINRAFAGLNQNTFLFVGYGLKDYNLRLIFKTSLWKKDYSCFRALQKWSIDISPDIPVKSIFVKDYRLTFIQKDIWCAIPYLYKLLFNEEMPLE